MLAIVALALLGQQAEKAPQAEGPSLIRYEVRFVDIEGIAWRQSMADRLKTLEAEDGSIAWLADPASILELELKARSSDEKPTTNPLHGDDDRKKRPEAPQIVAQPGTKAEIRSHQVIRYIAGVTPVEAKEGDETKVIGYQPILAKLNDGCAVSLTGMPQGRTLKLRAKVDECRLLGFSVIDVTAGSELSALYQVPEMLKGHVEGEWVIPEGQALILSLGPYTVADKDGKATTRERLVAISPKVVHPADLSAPTPAPITSAR
ncbi:MAG: hypothetical protein U0800_06600 [Isosphaeraceae bacterium]